MDKDKLFNDLLHAVQSRQPRLGNEGYEALTDSIMARIQSETQPKANPVIKILQYGVAIAAILIGLIVMIKSEPLEADSPEIVSNPYFNSFNTTPAQHRTDELNILIGKYLKKQNSKQDLATFTRQFMK